MLPLLILLSDPLAAADAAWSLTPTDGTWSGMNWTLGVAVPGAANGAPQAGDVLYFGTSSVTSLTSDLAGPFAGLRFATGANAFTIGGSSFALSGGITSDGAAQILNSDITLTADQTFGNASASGSLTLNGAVTGADRSLTTSAGAAAGVAAQTLFTGEVTLASLISQGTAGNNPTSAPQTDGIYTAEQSTTVTDATLNVSGNVIVGRSNLIFDGTTEANVTGSITNVGAASNDWASVVLRDSSNITAASLNLAGSVATGQFQLHGGTLTVGSISARDSTDATFPVHNVFNGTQVIASQSNPNFLTITKSQYFAGGSTAYVGNDGALFDTNGFAIATGAAFADDTGATGSLTKSGSGTLTLSGINTYTGATDVLGGTLRIHGSLAADSTVSVADGAGLGGSGSINGPVSLATGSDAAQQGAIDLVDNGFGDLTLTHSAGLTLGGTAGNAAKLDFEVGSTEWDGLSLESNPLTVNDGGAIITITDRGLEAGETYTLVTFGSGTGSGFTTGTGVTVGSLTLGNPTLVFGITGELNVTDTAIELVTSGASVPFTAYWSGIHGSSWTSIDGPEGNFTENSNGTSFLGTYPSSTTDVIFAANGNGAPANLSNTLGKDFNIYSLTFADGTPAVTISGDSRLTLQGGGIAMEAGNNGATLTMSELELSLDQSMSNHSEQPLAIDATIVGSGGVEIDGTGSGPTVFSAANTYLGGTLLDGGHLQLTGSGTLGDAAGPLTIDAGVLDLNGTSQAVGALEGFGGTIVNNATGTHSTLTVGSGNGGGIFEGVLADHLSGTGTLSLTKIGNGTLTLSGANQYTGDTILNGGGLAIGTNEVLPDGSVVEINNGAKLNLLGFTETIGGLSSTAGNANVVQNQEVDGAGTATLIIDTAGADFTFTGIIRDSFASTGSLALVKNGAGTQTLKSTIGLTGPGTFNDYTGGTTINGGTLLLSDSGNTKVIGSLASDITITDPSATLALENTLADNAQTLAPVISGSGQVVVTAGNIGTVKLSALNTYSGTTTVNAGTLSIDMPYLADGAGVILAADARLDLNFTGSDTVASLTIDGSTVGEGTWGASGSGAANIDDVHFSGTGVLQVGAPAPGYATWAAANAGGQGPELDFDQDGVQNGIEYFMGETGSSFTPTPGIVDGRIVWPKSVSFVGSYTVQTSPDLVTWSPASSEVVGDTVEYTIPLGQERLFVRLLVTPE